MPSSTYFTFLFSCAQSVGYSVAVGHISCPKVSLLFFSCTNGFYVSIFAFPIADLTQPRDGVVEWIERSLLMLQAPISNHAPSINTASVP